MHLKGGKKGKGAVVGKGAVLDDDDYFAMMAAAVDSDSEEEQSVSSREEKAPRLGGTKGGRKRLSGLPPPGPKGSKEAKARKREYDRLRNKRMGHGDYNTSVNLTGNHAPTIRPMTEVQGCRLSKGQTFSHRDIIILRVKEEANLRGLSVRTEISDNRQVVCWSREAVDFYVHATQSLTHAFR